MRDRAQPGPNRSLMAHRKPPCPVAGSRVVPRVTPAVSRAWPGTWAHSPLGQAGTTAVHQGGTDTLLTGVTSRIGTRLWVL